MRSDDFLFFSFFFFTWEKCYVGCCINYTLHHSCPLHVLGCSSVKLWYLLKILKKKTKTKIGIRWRMVSFYGKQNHLPFPGCGCRVSWGCNSDTDILSRDDLLCDGVFGHPLPRSDRRWCDGVLEFYAVKSGGAWVLCAWEGERLGRGTNKETALTFGLLERGGHKRAGLVEGTPHNQAPVSAVSRRLIQLVSIPVAAPVASTQGTHIALFKTHAHGTDSI